MPRHFAWRLLSYGPWAENRGQRRWLPSESRRRLRADITRILNARVYDAARKTPPEFTSRLSSRLGIEVWLRREVLQPVFSFKIRGAYNELTSLTVAERAQRVIAASAGSPAQGATLSVHRPGVRALKVMPEAGPRLKVDAVKRLVAEVLLTGASFDVTRYERPSSQPTRDVVIPPFDDEDVTASEVPCLALPFTNKRILPPTWMPAPAPSAVRVALPRRGFEFVVPDDFGHSNAIALE